MGTAAQHSGGCGTCTSTKGNMYWVVCPVLRPTDYSAQLLMRGGTLGEQINLRTARAVARRAAPKETREVEYWQAQAK